eukprot:s4367_g6.t1
MWQIVENLVETFSVAAEPIQYQAQTICVCSHGNFHMLTEPGGEPAPVDGARLVLRTAAEACLPALRAQIEATDLLPQQALGALSFCCEVLNRILVNLEDPDAYAKFSKLKVTAVRKRLPRRPDLTEAVLLATGFREAGDYFEWGPQSVEAKNPQCSAEPREWSNMLQQQATLTIGKHRLPRLRHASENHSDHKQF